MALRLLGQSPYLVFFSLYPSLFWEQRQKLKKFIILTLKPCHAMLEYQYNECGLRLAGAQASCLPTK